MVVLGFSGLWNLWLKQRHCLYLQQLIMILPILKTLHTLFITVNIALCFDQVKWETANKYLIMGIISFETLFQTILLTSFLSIAKGWGIVRYYVLREEASNLTIALGLVYLHFSAFFVTIELPAINMVVKVGLLFLIDFLYIAFNSSLSFDCDIRSQQILLGQSQATQCTHLVCGTKQYTFYWDFYSAQEENAQVRAFNFIKAHFSQSVVCALFYCMYQFMNILAVSNLQERLVANNYHQMILARSEFFSLLCISYLLYCLRARDWPAYFEMNIYPLALGNGQPLLNPFGFDPLLNQNQQRQILRPIASVIEMQLKKTDIASSFIDDNESESNN